MTHVTRASHASHASRASRALYGLHTLHSCSATRSICVSVESRKGTYDCLLLRAVRVFPSASSPALILAPVCRPAVPNFSEPARSTRETVTLFSLTTMLPCSKGGSCYTKRRKPLHAREEAVTRNGGNRYTQGRKLLHAREETALCARAETVLKPLSARACSIFFAMCSVRKAWERLE